LRISDGKSLKERRVRRKAASDKSGPDQGLATRALVLFPIVGHAGKARTNGGPAKGLNGAPDDRARSTDARLAETIGLARAIDLETCGEGFVSVPRPRPATLFGSGKVEELSGLVRAENAGLVIVDHPLTPVQQRNLERAWRVKVLDRTGLIVRNSGRGA